VSFSHTFLGIPIDRFSERSQLLLRTLGASVAPAEVTDNATVNAADVIIWMARGDSSRSLGAVAGTCLIDNTGGRFGD